MPSKVLSSTATVVEDAKRNDSCEGPLNQLDFEEVEIITDRDNMQEVAVLVESSSGVLVDSDGMDFVVSQEAIETDNNRKRRRDSQSRGSRRKNNEMD